MRKIRGLRWWMIGLIMLGSIINYLTRSTLAVAAPDRAAGPAHHEQQYSWIVGAFQGAIMLQPLCGYVLDVLGLKIGFAHLRDRLVAHQHGARRWRDSWQASCWPARAARASPKAPPIRRA